MKNNSIEQLFKHLTVNKLSQMPHTTVNYTK